jgi:hypothetical protein
MHTARSRTKENAEEKENTVGESSRFTYRVKVTL